MALWSLKGHRILIVDDFAEMRTMLRRIVEGFGAEEVAQARDGSDAVEALSGARFDVVLCDYNLGEGQDGQQVLEEARHRQLLPRSSVFVMVTAENAYDMVMGAVEFEPDAYLSKPVSKAIIQLRLRKLLERRESLLEITRAIDALQLEKALVRCERRLAGSGPFRLEVAKLTADLLWKLDRHAELIALCREMLSERSPIWASLYLGRAQRAQGTLDEALSTFQHIASENPGCVAAHDEMARCYREMGSLEAAQHALEEGARRSPKSLERQRLLGDIAQANGDLQACARARRHAVMVGKHSPFKRPSDYTRLAGALIESGSPSEALAAAQSIRYRFPGNHSAAVQGNITQSSAHRAMNNPKAAEEARDAALALADRGDKALNGEAALEVIRECLSCGEADRIESLTTHAIENHHEDEHLIAAVQAAYEAAGLGEAGAALIDAARADAVEINNKGVWLAEEGLLTASVQVFEQAVERMPGNCVINLNAAQSTIMSMRGKPLDRRRVQRVVEYLEVARDDPRYRQKHRRLQGMLRELLAGAQEAPAAAPSAG